MASPPIPALTGLRFVAAATVVFAHAFHKFMPLSGDLPWWYLLPASLSGIGMPLFFVLSGFVIHYNYSAPIEGERARGTFNFLVARFARLYPLYIVGLSFDLLNSYSYYQLSPHAAPALPYYLTMTQTWVYGILGDRSLIYVFGPLPQVAWSISGEWFFYLAYPFICAAIAKARRTSALVLALVILVIAGYGLLSIAIFHKAWIASLGVSLYGPIANDVQYSFFRWAIYFSPCSRILEFLLGCLVAAIFMRLRSTVDGVGHQARGLLTTIGALVAIGLLYAVIFAPRGRLFPSWVHDFHLSFGLAPALALLIFCCARYQNAIVDALSGRWIVLCGEASYSLYLLHMIVIDRLGMQSPAPTNLRIALGDLLRLAFCFLTCVGLSLVTWRLIEVPARRWLRQTLSIPSKSAAIAGSKTAPRPDRTIA